ncbi:methyltransferase [bacterium]|nr:methyltransferase [bacterium]
MEGKIMNIRDKDEQELFWSGDFGNSYLDRNNDKDMLAGKISLFAQATKRLNPIHSVIELGCNRGLNAHAIKALYPNCEYTGVEIGDKAYAALQENSSVDFSIFSSIYDVVAEKKYDLVLVAGVLIHLNPNKLSQVYSLVAQLSKSNVIFAEYYNPTPVAIEYRGHKNKLFKRDFAGEFMERHDFILRDYGFVYSRDPKFDYDDLTWFTMEKK